MWPFSRQYAALSAEELSQRDKSFDYIVVGGGSAGCCLAARLSEDRSATVLLIERGSVANDWASRVPLISANQFRNGAPVASWPISPMKQANGRVLDVVIGEGLGGGSRINSGVYTRGIGDFNAWRDMGHPSWSYDEMEPYFVKSEHTLSHPASKFRGKTGPWINQTFPVHDFNCMSQLVDAAKNIGIPTVADVNSPSSPAVCCANLDVAIDSNMRRMSTMDTFLPLKSVSNKQNLVICAKTIVTRIRFGTVDHSLRAIGIYYEATNLKATSRNFYMTANREIILCAGAAASPQLLMLSGIGPRSHLAEHGINVIRDHAGVGNHLKDHASLPVMYEVPLEDTLHVIRNKPLRAMTELLRYLISGKSLFGRGFLNWTIFVRSSLLNPSHPFPPDDPSTLDVTLPENTPDIEIMPVPHRCSDGEHVDIDHLGVFSLLTCLVRPKSYGTVRLASTDPHARAAIDLGFLSNPEDFVIFRAALRLALKLAHQIRSQGYPLENILVPASDSDADLDAFIRQNIRSSFHYSSSCRMGRESDPHPGVVDDDLKVHGVQGLRICDTSVFPDIVSTHTMAPVVAVAEKCADLIKSTWRE